jgi:hypothetical protein
MGRKKKTEALEPDIISEEIEYDAADIESALAGLPDEDSIIYLYRMPEDRKGRPKFLTKLEPSEFDLISIKNIYGGGRYKYIAKKSGIIYKNGIFEIEGEPKMESKSNGESVINQYDVIAMLQDEIKTLKAELMKKNAENEHTLTTLIASIIQNQNRNTDTEEKILQKLVTYKSLFASENTGPNITSELILNAITKGIELASMSQGGDMPLWMKIIDGLKEPLTKLAESISTTKSRPMKSQPQPQAQPQQAQTTENQFISQAKPYLNMLIVAASKNSDPGIYANMILDMIGPYQEQFISWLKKPNWLEELVKIDQRVALQSAWWNELKECILSEIEEGKSEINDASAE